MAENLDAEAAWARVLATPQARWDYDPARFGRAPMDVVHRPKFQIPRDAAFFCIGSCFARNVEEHLLYGGMNVLSKRIVSPLSEWKNRPNAIVNKYTLASMLNEVVWTHEGRDEFGPGDFIEVAGGWLDPQLSPAALPASLARCIERRRYLGREFFARLRAADVVVLTLGLIEAWQDRATGTWLNGSPPLRQARAEPGRFAFRVTDAAENAAWLEAIHARIRAMNGSARFIVTVSPVPMHVSFSGLDSAVAHTLSKATLRVVAEAFTRDRPDADYFPSYEMIAMAPRRETFAPDHIHILDAAVGGVVQAFLRAYVPDAPPPVLGYNEMAFLRANEAVYARVRAGELASGFEHWLAQRDAAGQGAG